MNIKRFSTHLKKNKTSLRYGLRSIFLTAALLSSLLNPGGSLASTSVDAPVLISPVNSTTTTAVAEAGSVVLPPLGIPQFSWQAVAGATSYILRLTPLAGQCQSSPPQMIEYTTSLTTFLPPNVSNLPDGLWFWCVRVNASQAPFSEIRSFTKDWSSASNTPALVKPADGETINFFDSTVFSWQPVVGAANYRFEIASAPDFTTKLFTAITAATTIQPANKLANGAYYWRVIPLDPASHEGTVSPAWMFNQGYGYVPAPLEPANGSSPTFTPTFHWAAVRGAQSYTLQYSPDINFINSVSSIGTANTKYTPTGSLNNDTTYYWRVRAVSNNSISDWSNVWSFFKQWYIRPVLLTPTNNALHVRIPFFTWTPVPGAATYLLEVSTDNNFSSIVISAGGLSNNFYSPSNYDGAFKRYYWRVTPYDAAGRPGKPSQPFSYDSSADAMAPDLIYPYFYYQPNTFPAPDQAVTMNPYQDRTALYPVFYWHRLTNPYSTGGGTAAYSYRLEVDTSPTFSSPIWSVNTENTHAAPTISNPFTPQPNTNYFWRVHGLNKSGAQIGDWSQTWLARFNIPGTGGAASPVPVLLRPTDASEIVDATPIFEWQAVAGAASYQVQIANEPSFGAPFDSATTPYPVYSPVSSLAQRLLGKVNFGTYYWRVQALDGVGAPLGGWSATWRFQVAAQSERTVVARTDHTKNDKFLIARDQNGDAAANYDLTSLYAAQDSDYWYFGFGVTSTLTNTTFVLYLDVDAKDNSGASIPPPGVTVLTNAAHRPEFAIIADEVGGAFAASNVEVYAWNGSAWDIPRVLESIGGKVNTSGNYVEIGAPITAIGSSEDTGSYSLSLISMPFGGGQPQDSVPSDPLIPGGGPISRFASVSERLNPILPPNTSAGESLAYPFVPPFFWDYPSGSNGTAPWIGVRARVYLDAGATTQVAEFIITSNSAYYSSTEHHWAVDFAQGDKPYYWRIQPIYTGSVYGAWTQIQRMVRSGWRPQSLSTSIPFATPTFYWDRVEGALYYELMVDTDPGFSSPDISVGTSENSYTPPFTLISAQYYWKLRVIRPGVTNEWSSVMNFDLAYGAPTGLTPNDPDPLNAFKSTPKFCWNTILQPDDKGNPTLAGFNYRVQVSTNNTFAALYDAFDTEQSCWTPTKGYADGTYYWRVAMMDGSNHFTPYSATAMFVKQSLLALPKFPVANDTVTSTPTFRWTGADGITPYIQGASSYIVKIYTDPLFSVLYDEVTTNNTSFTPVKIYDFPKKYYWRVAMVDSYGNQGPFSDAVVLVDPKPFHLYLASLNNR